MDMSNFDIIYLLPWPFYLVNLDERGVKHG